MKGNILKYGIVATKYKINIHGQGMKPKVPGLQIRSIFGSSKSEFKNPDPDPGFYWHLPRINSNIAIFFTSNIFLLIFE